MAYLYFFISLQLFAPADIVKTSLNLVISRKSQSCEEFVQLIELFKTNLSLYIIARQNIIEFQFCCLVTDNYSVPCFLNVENTFHICCAWLLNCSWEHLLSETKRIKNELRSFELLYEMELLSHFHKKKQRKKCFNTYDLYITCYRPCNSIIWLY